MEILSSVIDFAQSYPILSIGILLMLVGAIVVLLSLFVKTIVKILRSAFKKKEKANSELVVIVEEEKNDENLNMKVGDIVIFDHKTHSKHFLIAATTGAMKTQTMLTIQERVFYGIDNRSDLEKAFITDPSGEFYSSRRNDTDILLNPLDKRSVRWNPFLEIEKDTDFDLVGRALFPEPPSASAAEWTTYARNFFTDVAKVLVKIGSPKLRDLEYFVNQASRDELIDILVGTPSELLVGPDGDNLLKSVRFVATDSLRALSFVEDGGDFSIRRWVRDGKGALFLTYRDAEFDSLSPLIRMFITLCIRETLSLSPNDDRRVWLMLDELDSLGKVDFLTDALARGRKYGLACIAAIQSFSQLDSKYGPDNAKTLRSTFVSKIFLRQGSAEDAEIASAEIGEKYIKVDTEDGRTGIKTSTTEQARRIVTPTDFMSLAPGKGFCRLATNDFYAPSGTLKQIPRISVPYQKIQVVREPFIVKVSAPPAPVQVPAPDPVASPAQAPEEPGRIIDEQVDDLFKKGN